MIKYIRRIIISLLCVLLTTALLCACHAEPQTTADTEIGTDINPAINPEVFIDIEEYRRLAMELCENDPVGPGYITLTLNDDYTLCAVRIEFPAIGQDGKIHGTTDVEFSFDGRKPVVFPYVTETDYYEQRKYLNAVRILKGIYGVYMLYTDGTLECDAGGFTEESLHDKDRIDREKFGVGTLLETYGIDITKITNAAVTADYQK